MQIPDYFKFYNKTRIISGKKALENIPFELKNMDSVKPIVITDKNCAESGLVKILQKAFGDSNLTIGAIFDDVTYPSIKKVKDAAFLFRERGCDSIIALGGENVASVAKAVNIIVSSKKDDIEFLKELKDLHLKPLFFVATSNISGLESSSKALIDNRAFEYQELMPDIAFIDPRMLKKNKDKKGLFANAIKAMVIAIEACSEDSANPMNDSFAFSSIQLIFENLTKAAKTFSCSKSRLGLAGGIAISGIVYSNANTGLCSALSEELSKITGFSSNIIFSILLPHVLEYKLKNTKSGIRDEILLPLAGLEKYSMTADKSEEGVSLIKNLIYNSPLPKSLKELNIPLYKIEDVADSLDKQFAKQYGKDAYKNILFSAYEGKELEGGKA